MSSINDLHRKLVERFKNSPEMRAIRRRFEFDAAMVVVTYGDVDYFAARDFFFSHEMCGRTRIKSNMTDDIVQWFFELEGDAVLFSLKFCNSLPKRLT